MFERKKITGWHFGQCRIFRTTLHVCQMKPLKRRGTYSRFSNLLYVLIAWWVSFRAKILVSLAPGLATFINCSDESLRLIISPLLPNRKIKEAIEDSIVSTEDFYHQRIGKTLLLQKTPLHNHTLKMPFHGCLRHGRVWNQNCLDERCSLPSKGLALPRRWRCNCSARI